MLLSLPAQSRLGLIKDVRAGRCLLKDFPGEGLRIGRHRDTGLLLVCLTQYGEKTMKNLEKFQISKPLKDPELAFMVGQGNADKNTVEVTSFHTEPPLPVCCKKIILVTCGIERTDSSDKSLRRDHTLSNLLQQLGSSYRFSLSDRSHRQALTRSLLSNFAFLQKAKEEDVLLIDCREVGDPAHDRRFRDHLGVYPPNLKNMTGQPAWRATWKTVPQKRRKGGAHYSALL
jgi:hypothetical protein